jgi:hypothetical protein
MKTRAVPVGQVRIGSVVRQPIGQTLYHRVKRIALISDTQAVVHTDGGRHFSIDPAEHLYVLEDEPAPIVLDGLTLA